MPGADKWATDTPISEPVSLDPKRPGHAPLGAGWTFTADGMRPDLTEDVAEVIFTPTYAPRDFERG